MNKLFNPKISIITCVYNGEKYISALFDSILNQKYNNIEHIIVNDGSTDNTELVIKKYEEKYVTSGIKLIYIKQKNKGLGEATNVALKYVSGEYWTWINCDDFYKDNCFQRMLSYLSKNRSVDVVHFNYEYCIDNGDGHLQKTGRNGLFYSDRRIYKNKKTLCKHFYLTDHFSFLLYFVKTSSFKSINPTMSFFPIKATQDVQLAAQIYPNLKCRFLNEELMVFRGRKDSWYTTSHTPAIEFKESMINSIDMLKISHKKKTIIKARIKTGDVYKKLKDNVLISFNKRDIENTRLNLRLLNEYKINQKYCTWYLSRNIKLSIIAVLSKTIFGWNMYFKLRGGKRNEKL